MTKYLFDSNIFIQAKNFHYHFGYCAAFWDWINAAHSADLVFSTQKVRTELMRGNADDPLVNWINQLLPETFFVEDLHDPAVMREYASVMQIAAANPQYTSQAKAEFAKQDVADAFLVATAKAHRYVLVTFERNQPEARKRIPLPDIATQCGVQTEQFWTTLKSMCNGTFNLQYPAVV